MKASELSTFRNFFERSLLGLITSRTLMALLCAQMVFFGFEHALYAAPPVADAGADIAVEKNLPLGAEVELDGTGSSDPDGDPLSFLWLGAFGSAGLPSPVVSLGEGLHAVTLRVDDGTSVSPLDSALVEVVPCFEILARAKGNKVQVSWPPQAGAQKYEVYRSDQDTPSNFVKIGESPAGIQVYSDLGLVTERTYLYVVNALMLDGRSCFSSIAGAHPTSTRGRFNYAPVIYSEAATTGTAEVLYTYDVNAVDPNADVLTYSLDTAPAGMSIDPASGLIQWTPAAPGNSNVTVRASDPAGLFDTQSFTIAVGQLPGLNQAPVADAGTDQLALVGDTVTLDGSGSSDPDGDPLTFSWSFTLTPPGSSAALSDPNAVAPTFEVDAAGVYVAELVVNDGLVDSAPDTAVVVTLNSAPVADAGPDQTALVGDTVTLDGSGSSDLDADPLTYSWSLTSPAGSSATLSDPTAVMPSFAVDVPGSYTAQLIVNDGFIDSAPDSVVVTTGNSAPVADAGPNQTVLVGDPVTLDGSGSSDVDGDALSFSWSLTSKPAGSTAALSDPSAVSPAFVADVAGSYVAQLIVNDGTVGSAPDTVTITTGNSPPVAEAGPGQTVLVGDTVTLDGSGSSDVDGDALSFFWSLTSVPAGSAAAVSDPTAVTTTFVADVPGAYVAQLIVNDGTADSAPDTVTIVTGNSPPVADAGPDQSVLVGDGVTLDGSGSSDVDGDALSFSWSLTSVPAGSAASLGDPTLVMPTFVADLPGSYVAQLIVNDGTVDSAPDTVTIVTGNSPPVAGAGPDQTVLVGDTVTLDGGTSSDVDGDALTFSWSLTSVPIGSSAALSDPSAVMPTFVADAPGSYVAQLIVNDGTVDSAPDTVTITTGNSPPVADAGPDQTVLVGDGVTLDGSGSSDVDGDALTFSWSLTSKPAGSAATLGDPSAVVLTFVADLPGSYVAQLIVNDGIVDSAPDTVTIVTGNSPPVADAGPDQTVALGSTVTLDGSGSSDVDGDALTFAWSLTSVPLGSTAALSDPFAVAPGFVADLAGTYVAQLIVNDGTVDSAPDCVMITTANSRPVAEAGPSLEVELGSTVTLDGSASFDADGDPLTFSWSFTSRPAGSSATLSDPSAVSPTFVPDVEGFYTVQLIVSDGVLDSAPDTATFFGFIPTVEVPDVVGLPQAAAQAAILGAGFTVGAVTSDFSDTVPPFSVISQNPPGGAEAPEGSAVDLVVSLGPEPVTVPDVVGLPEAAAEAAILGAGLTVGAVTTANSDTVPAGAVISQNPLGGSVEAPGTAVDLVVSLGPPLINVPDVVGLPQAAAEATIVAAGLTVGAVTTANSPTVPAGNVISQNPAAGSSVTPASAVDIVVSLGPSLVPDTLRPEVTLVAIPGPITGVGSTINLQVTANDNVGVTATELRVGGVVVPLDGSGLGTFSSATPGLFPAEATASDAAGNTGNASVDLRVLTTGDVTPPVVSLTAPADGAVLTVPEDLIGTASDANLLQYIVEISPKDRNQFVQIASGTTSVTNGVLGKIDPTMLRNGLYDLRLTAEDTSGISASVVRCYQMDGEAKVGNFTLSFEDLTIPVAGIPITVTRTYDSRVKSKGDFGIGWMLDLSEFKLEENTPPGEGWQAVCTRFLFGTCLEHGVSPTIDHRVIITRPDGRVDEFQIGADAVGGVNPVLISGNLTFTALPGTFSTLQALGNANFDLVQSGQLLDFSFNEINPNRYRLTDPDGTSFVIDQTNGLESITEPNGSVITFGPGGIIHSAGKSVLFDRDAMGRITRITDPMGNEINYEYDFYGDLVSVTDQENNTTSHTYNSSHGLLEIIDPLGVGAVRNEYDTEGRLLATIDADGNRIELTHDLNAQQEITRDRLGNVTIYSYDAAGNITQSVDALGNTTNRTFDPGGNETSLTDPLGNTITRTYDARDSITSNTDPLGNTTNYTNDAAGRPTTIVDPRGNSQSQAYDARGNLLSQADPLGNLTTFVYDAAGNILVETDPLGNVSTNTYDGFGNVIRAVIESNLGTVLKDTTYSYDANGNRVLENFGRTLPGGSVESVITHWEYDGLNRLVRTILPDGTSTSVAYTPTGKEMSHTDELGRATQFEYDNRGNLLRTIRPDGSTETKTYDAEDRMVSVVDFRGETTNFTYDALGRLTQTQRPDGSVSIQTYDAAGRVISETDALGNITSFEYDAAGRTTKTTDPLGNQTTFGYDAAGNRATVTDANGNTTTFVYDAANRIIQTAFADGTSQARSYDAMGRVAVETDQNGNSKTMTYDGLGRLTAVTDALGQTTSYSYDEASNLTSQTDAEGRVTTFQYDIRGRRTARLLPDGKTETASYDGAGNLVSKSDFNGFTTTFQYDALNRLVSKTADPAHPSRTLAHAATTLTYSYDAGGKRTAQNVENHNGAIIHSESYTYDSNGRMVLKTTPDDEDENSTAGDGEGDKEA